MTKGYNPIKNIIPTFILREEEENGFGTKNNPAANVINNIV